MRVSLNLFERTAHWLGDQPARRRVLLLVTTFSFVALLMSICPQRSMGQLELSGGLTLVQEGPAAAMAGDAAPVNLTTGAVPFTSSDLGPEIGVEFHAAVNLNDGFYGNASSWIGGSTNPYPVPFAGIDLGAPVANIQSIAFGRSNVLGGDACGVCTDRNLGLYTLEYTQVASPSTNLDLASTGDASTGWAPIGTLNYVASTGPGTNFNNTWQRHRYNFSPISATGVRLVVPESTAIDEIELYDVAGDYVPPPPPPNPITFAPESGFTISWNENDGDYSATGVPENVALASSGATAFSSSDLGPEIGITFHTAGNLNDGLYGNGNSWIGGDTNEFAEAFAGVAFAEETSVSRIAWGRDNLQEFVDRWEGVYTLQFTQLDAVDATIVSTGDPATGWANVGTIELTAASVADGPGGNFTGPLRHEFEFGTEDGSPLLATGVRLLVPATGIGGGTAIDELEVYAVPEPGTSLLLLTALATFLGSRRGSRS